MTSRLPLGDIIETIANLIASVSHLQELINADGETEENKKRYEEMVFELTNIRRAVMKQLPVGEEKFWCSVKHAIAQWSFALEVYYAENTIFWKEIVEALSKNMYKIISEYIGMEITDCGRCLNDKLKDIEEHN